jgi:acyl carrier protein
MNATEIRSVVLKVLGDVAPEVASVTLDDAEPIREQLDLDSMDFLNFVIGLHRALNVDIPETNYAKVQTLVYDLTGNVDEWTDGKISRGNRSILKGGYWGQVRARCRPSTRVHGEDFACYQQGFRCCADWPRR